MTNGGRTIFAVALASSWIGLSEFIRNQLILDAVWRDYYGSLHLEFPSAPVNAAIWMVWSFAFATVLHVFSRRYSLLQTTLLGWVTGFVMMWLVAWNLRVLPSSILPYAIPLSLLESFVASFICIKVNPPCCSSHCKEE